VCHRASQQQQEQEEEEEQDPFVDEEWLNQQCELEAMGLPTRFAGAPTGSHGRSR
jgi:hypothetical protein